MYKNNAYNTRTLDYSFKNIRALLGLIWRFLTKGPVDALGTFSKFNGENLDVLVVDERLTRNGSHSSSRFAQNHVLYNPALIKQILKDNETFQKPPVYQKIVGLFNRFAILSSGHEEWQRQRRILHSLFKRQAVDTHAETIQDQLDILFDKWQKNKATGDLYRDLSVFTIHTFFNTYLKKDAAPYVERLIANVKTVNRSNYRHGVNPLTYIFNKRFSFLKQSKDARQDIKSVIESIVEEDMHEYRQGELVSEILNDVGYYASPTQENLDQACEEVFHIMGAGIETTSSTLTWLLYELEKHPEWQDKLREEIEVCSKDGETPKFADLKEHQKFINETIRLHSPVHTALPRQANKDITLEGGYQINKFDLVIIPIQSLHLNERNFHNPYDFDPERYATDNVRARVKESVVDIPFLEGPHRCIGSYLFMKEAVMLLSGFVQRFDVVPSQQNLKAKFYVTAVPEGRYDMTFKLLETQQLVVEPASEAELSVVPELVESADGGGCPFHSFFS